MSDWSVLAAYFIENHGKDADFFDAFWLASQFEDAELAAEKRGRVAGLREAITGEQKYRNVYVEAAAKALYNDNYPPEGKNPAWEEIEECGRNIFRIRARSIVMAVAAADKLEAETP